MASSRRRIEEREGQEHNERWLLTYSDLITLLMVLFVVMYSLGRTDPKRFGAITAAMERAFNVGVFSDTGAVSGRAAEIRIGLGGSHLDSAVLPAVDPSAGASGRLAIQVLRIAQLSGADQAVTVLPHPEGTLVRIAGNLLFDSGKADLKPEGLAFLDNLATLLKHAGNQVRIEGHTDNIPMESVLYPSNWELSAARAVTVLRYLSEYGSLPPDRLSAAGFGEYRPIATNATREGRAANRRVDIVILEPSGSGDSDSGALAATPVPSERDSGQ